MSNPDSKGQIRAKPFRDALRMESKLAEDGVATPALPGSIRFAARQLLERAALDTAAFREAADRLDGKVAQAVEHSGADGGPIEHRDLNAVDYVTGTIARLSARGGQGGDPSKPH